MSITSRLKRYVYRLLQYWVDRGERQARALPDLSLWGLKASDKQHLMIGGCDCVELAAKYETPLFVVDQHLLEKNFAEFHAGFAAHSLRFEILYSYKTNPVPAILRTLHLCGAGAEVISPYELWLALELGVKPDAIVYNGPNKPDEGLRLAVRKGIKLINVNSFSEIEKLASLADEYGARPAIGVRVSTTAGWGAQFGFKLESGEALAAFERVSHSRTLRACAIHAHLGTNVSDPGVYQSALTTLLHFAKELKDKLGIHIQYLDLGGGFAVPTVRSLGKQEIRLNTFLYKPYDPPAAAARPSVASFAGEIAATFHRECQSLGLEPPILLFEPGRVMTSNTEILLTTVGDFKQTRNGFRIALLDAGINIAQPMSWEYHEVLLANRLDAPYDQRYGLAGPICTPSDFYLKSKRLPELAIGDLLCILDAGAYFTSFANDFSFPRPAIIMINDGQDRVIRKRERFGDLIDHDVAA
jgi:diaminopimelate decarboxylase